MPNWLVRLKGEKFDLEELPSLLNSPELNIIEDNGSFYLISSNFNSLKLAKDVRKQAVAIIEILNGAIKLLNNNFQGITEDDVILIKADGKYQHHVNLKGQLTFRSKVKANSTIYKSNGKKQITKQPNNIESWYNLAMKDKDVADALHFYRKDSWVSLYKVYEIIRDDVGSKITKGGWVTETQIRLFKQTAQSRFALGDNARHAAKKYTSPEQPMSVNDARLLIKGVLLNWIRSKS